MRRIFVLGATAAAMALAAACVGEEPTTVTSTPDGGPPTSSSGGTEAGLDAPVASEAGDAADATKDEPAIIDRWSITTAPWTGTFAACVNAIDGAVKAMGGGYVAAGTASTFSRYGNRPGAVVSGTCVDTTSSVVLSAWAIEGAADVTNDELRLRKLVANEIAPAASPLKGSLPEIRAEKRIHAVAAIPLSTCVNRAEKAITKLLDQSPVQTKRWTDFKGTSVRAAGVAATSASITCVGDTGTVVIDAFTIDPAIPTTTLVNSLVTEFVNAT